MAILFTEMAAAKALEFRVKEQIPDSQILRVCINGGGCAGFSYGMYFDDKNGDDREFEFNGLKVCIDSFSLHYMDGTTIDYIEGLGNSGFRFDNPNIRASCGCGKSFSPK